MGVALENHKVKNAVEIQGKRGFAIWYVAECVCGWSSRLYETASGANQAYKLHKENAASTVKSTEGTGS